MPQIQEYSSQVGAQGPVGGTSPNIELAAAPGRGLTQLGESISEGAELIHRRAAQEETADVYSAFADKRAQYITQVQSQIQDGTLDVNKLADQYDEDTSSMSDQISTPEGKYAFERQQSRLRGHIVQMAMSGKAQVAANDARAKWKNAIDTNSSVLMRDPGSFQHVYEDGLESIDQLIKSGGLPEKYRQSAVNQMGEEYAKNAIRGVAELDPDQAKQMLDKGKFDQFVSGDVKHQLYAEVQHYSSARDIEDRRAEKAQEDAKKKGQEAWGAQALPKLTQNALSTKDVLGAVQNGTIDWEHGQRWLNMIKEGSKEDLKTNSRVKNDLIRRIVDPNTTSPIMDSSDLMPYVGKGISISDFNQMNSLFNKTPEGQALQQGEKNLFQMAKSTIRFKNPMTGQYDTLGEQKLSQFMNDYIEAKKGAKQGGNDLKNLLDPTSPTYFGKQIENYQTPLQEQLSHVSQDRTNKALGLRPSRDDVEAKPTDKNVRQPGESAEAYLKRRGLGG